PLQEILQTIATARAPQPQSDPYDGPYDEYPPQSFGDRAPQPAAVAPPQRQVDPFFVMLQQPVAFLVSCAERNAPVGAAVDWLFNSLSRKGVPDDARDAFWQRRDLLQVLAAINPKVMQLQQWFSALIDEARQPQENFEVDDESTEKSTADPVGNAA